MPSSSLPLDPLFAVRGILAFFALTEFTHSIRCFLRTEPASAQSVSYVRAKLFAGADLPADAAALVSDVLGIYSLLTGLVALHLAVYSHCKPLVSLAFCAVSAKLVLFSVHAFYFGSVVVGRELVFPIVSGVVCLAAVIAVPFLVKEDFYTGEEEDLSLKKMNWMKKNKKKV